MGYGDFGTIKAFEEAFGLRSRVAPLFGGVSPSAAPDWLRGQLARGQRIPLMSEQVRGELIVMSVLQAAVDLASEPITIYSGARLDADPGRGLAGECDFMLGRSEPFPEVRTLLVTMVEAKKADIDLGLGQCAAQMVGAKAFNEREECPPLAVYGCVTSGHLWQFLRLAGSDLVMDSRRFFLSELDDILGVFRTILAAPVPASGAAA